MTIDDLVKLANACATTPDVTLEQIRALATAVVDRFGEGSPCGYELPYVCAEQIGIPASWAAMIPREDVDSLARVLLRSVDEAEASAQ